MRHHMDILHDDYAGFFDTIVQIHDLANGLNMVTNILFHVVLNREHKVILAVEFISATWGHAIFVDTISPGKLHASIILCDHARHLSTWSLYMMPAVPRSVA